MKILTRILVYLWLASSALGATLLPLAKQQFVDGNGKPYAGGFVYFYIPSTTTLKTTWIDPDGVVPNSNPVVLDGAGRAIIYGSGAYRQVLKDSLGNIIWDQLTADTSSAGVNWGGTSGGSANAQTVTASNFSSAPGQIIEFIAGFTNTGLLSLNPNGIGPIAVKKDTPSGSVFTSGGEVVAGNLVSVVYDPVITAFHIVNLVAIPGQITNVASAGVMDIGLVPSHFINITGTTTITSLGSSCSTAVPVYKLKFAGALTLTYNATSLITPGAKSILTIAGDEAEARCLGSGNWIISNYVSYGVPGNVLACPPQTTVYSNPAGSSGTYTTPSCGGGLARFLEVEFVAGGGGGGGSASGANDATAGGNGGVSSFGTALFSATGGAGGAASNSAAPSTGGAGGVGSGCLENLAGSVGGHAYNSSSPNSPAGVGGSAVKWGIAGTTAVPIAGHAGLYGGGGAGGSANSASTGFPAGGGGGGGYCHGFITTPAASYAYVQGAPGTAGAAGSVGYAGGAGGIGYMIVVAKWY